MKGGGAEMTGAAKIVMQDWNAGKIPFYTMPPENKTIVESTIVQQWSKEFNLDEVMKMERDFVMKKLHDPAEDTVFSELVSFFTQKNSRLFILIGNYSNPLRPVSLSPTIS
jgi:hypothetical protein